MTKNLYGALFMTLSMFGYASTDAFIKFIGLILPLSEILFLRGIVAVFLLFLLTYIRNEFFIKIKPTIVSIIIAGVLASGKILGKNPLAAIMKSAVSLKEEGWDKLTWLWVGMFIVMAIANEIAWRNLTTDQWVSFKAFGIPILSLGFGLLSLPIMQKYQIKKD